MSSISSTSYVLPPLRPWDPSRVHCSPSSQRPNHATECNDRLESDTTDNNTWIEGSIVKGHPNICPLHDFFEDDHYYYLILPSITPIQQPNGPPPPTDLFDLVEGYPQGLPPSTVRSYLGQIADALSFLHAQGIGEFVIIRHG
jgi:protein-serine/threonine kinase